MATATSMQSKSLGEIIHEMGAVDPKATLNMVLAENERIQAEARANADVTFGANGLQATNMAGLWRLAMIYSKAAITPESFRGKIENCFIALQMAQRMGVDGFAFMQKCYIVHGRPAIETQLAIAIANTSGVFGSRIRYQLSGVGDKRQCRAYVKDKETGEEVEHIVSVAIAKSMGWWSKIDRNGNESSMWPKMTDLMLQYRSALWLIRTNAPEVLMGVATKDEAEDIGEPEPPAGVNGSRRPTSLSELTDRMLGGNGNGSPTVEESGIQSSDVETVDNGGEVTGAEAEHGPDVERVSENEDAEPVESSEEDRGLLASHAAQLAKCTDLKQCIEAMKEFPGGEHLTAEAERLTEARKAEIRSTRGERSKA